MITPPKKKQEQPEKAPWSAPSLTIIDSSSTREGNGNTGFDGVSETSYVG